MCGIVGYTGTAPVRDILLEGLRKLEYRGYDSAGIAVETNDKISIVRRVGKVEELAKAVEDWDVTSTCGIGHTRWATHGRPTEPNAHPHSDCSGKIAVVHNGIIENFVQLRDLLESEGHVFKSETDTEIVAHLIEKYYDGDLIDALATHDGGSAGRLRPGRHACRSSGRGCGHAQGQPHRRWPLRGR